MPFEPLRPEESREFEFCRHPEHYPPSHIWLAEPMRWVCPGCGASYVVGPPIWCSAGGVPPP